MEFGIRMGVPDDADAICSLIQELADFEHMSEGEGPKLDPIQLEEDLAAGSVHSLIAFSTHNDLAGHALYYYSISVTDGKSIFLEDLYVRPPFRRNGLGRRMICELTKIAKHNHCSYIRWTALQTNIEATSFYAKLGAPRESRMQWWRLERSDLWKVIAEAKQRFVNNPMTFELLMDGEKMDEEQADAWADECTLSLRYLRDAPLQREREKCLRLFCSASLGAIIARIGEKVLGAALFHRKAYSSWTGSFLVVDQLVVRPEFRRKGIAKAILAQLAMVALKEGYSRIGFTPQPKGCEAEPFFKSLNCMNLTTKVGLLTYRLNI